MNRRLDAVDVHGLHRLELPTHVRHLEGELFGGGELLGGGFDAPADLRHSLGSSKPAPDAFVVALRRAGADPARSLAVGDSVWDVKAAAASGMPCIGLQTGGIARRDLERAGAAAVYRDACELMHHWDQSPLTARRRAG